MTEGIEQWQEFRRAREAELTQPRGWLTLSGFHWLPKTPTELGSLPGRWSTDGKDAFLDASPPDGLTVDGELVNGRSRRTVAEIGRAPRRGPSSGIPRSSSCAAAVDWSSGCGPRPRPTGRPSRGCPPLTMTPHG